MFLGANWLLRRLRGKCREKGNAAAWRLFISQRFSRLWSYLWQPPFSLFSPFHFSPSPLTTWAPGHLVWLLLAWLWEPSTCSWAIQQHGAPGDPLLQPRQEPAPYPQNVSGSGNFSASLFTEEPLTRLRQQDCAPKGTHWGEGRRSWRRQLHTGRPRGSERKGRRARRPRPPQPDSASGVRPSGRSEAPTPGLQAPLGPGVPGCVVRRAISELKLRVALGPRLPTASCSQNEVWKGRVSVPPQDASCCRTAPENHQRTRHARKALVLTMGNHSLSQPHPDATSDHRDRTGTGKVDLGSKESRTERSLRRVACRELSKVNAPTLPSSETALPVQQSQICFLNTPAPTSRSLS
ncbi:uncharacterized protein LOC110347079 [Heterocephalus glaber]|uniref:Uncharacterized protein LOC110347079 n=1 Tax=Heterocephalus glaber TaxID=10181 RepID=A0AAX6SBD0_HETGA|nr:uncharacterized protein LOC110347079 [Heterocephalus glaber]